MDHPLTGTSTGSRRSSAGIRAVGQSAELSGRTDSPREFHEEASATMPLISRRESTNANLVSEAAAWIREKVATTLKIGAQEVGEYILNTFFDGDPDRAKSKNPGKSTSFRALVDKCGTPALPVSRTWLNNAVGIAIMTRQLPETASAFRQLPPSYQERLLPLADPEMVERAAKRAITNHMSYRDLRAVVAEERMTIRNGQRTGRSRKPAILRTVNRSLQVFVAEAGKRLFTASDLEELDHAQKKEVLKSAEALMERLRNLVLIMRR